MMSSVRSEKRGVKRGRMPLVALLVVLGLAGAALFMSLGGPRLSDQEQVYNILEELQGAVGKGSVDGVFKHVSHDFKFGAVTRQQAELQLMQVFRSASSTAVAFRNPQINVNGDTASLTVDTELSGASGQAANVTTFYKGTVTMDLRREATRRWVVFPGYEWKITRVEASGSPETEGM